ARLDQPAPLAVGAAEDRDDVLPALARGGQLPGLGAGEVQRARLARARRGQVPGDLRELADGLGPVQLVQPLLVLALVEPALGEGLAEPVGDALPVGVGGAYLLRVHDGLPLLGA